MTGWGFFFFCLFLRKACGDDHHDMVSKWNLQCHVHTNFMKKTRSSSPRTLRSENPQAPKEKEAESYMRPPLFPWETNLNGYGPMMIITKWELDGELCVMQGDIRFLLTSSHCSSVHDSAHTNGFGHFFSILKADLSLCWIEIWHYQKNVYFNVKKKTTTLGEKI